MKKTALFPGSFDPFTKGHEAIVHKALSVFDEIIILLAENTSKQTMFSLDKRMEHIAGIFEDNHSVSVQKFSGLTVNFASSRTSSTSLEAYVTPKTLNMNDQLPILILN